MRMGLVPDGVGRKERRPAAPARSAGPADGDASCAPHGLDDRIQNDPDDVQEAPVQADDFN